MVDVNIAIQQLQKIKSFTLKSTSNANDIQARVRTRRSKIKALNNPISRARQAKLVHNRRVTLITSNSNWDFIVEVLNGNLAMYSITQCNHIAANDDSTWIFVDKGSRREGSVIA